MWCLKWRTLAGTIRYFEQDVYQTATQRLQALCDGFATAFGVEVVLELRPLFNVLENDPDLSQAYLEAASDIVGPDNVSTNVAPDTASEDFADMLQTVPGSLLPRRPHWDNAFAQPTIHTGAGNFTRGCLNYGALGGNPPAA